MENLLVLQKCCDSPPEYLESHLSGTPGVQLHPNQKVSYCLALAKNVL